MPAMPVPIAVPAIGATMIEPRTSGMAIAGFVLSFFCGLLGLIFSIIGLSQIRSSNGALKGQGLAIAGIVISSLLGIVGVLAAVAIPAFMDYMQKSKASPVQVELRHLAISAKTYQELNDKLPSGSAPLTPSVSCCSFDRGKCPVDPSLWQAPEWQMLDFQIDEPTLARFSWTGDGTTFDAEARTDADCDGQEAVWHLHIEMVDGAPHETITKPPAGVY
ncbi:MAG TPA: hypothetical protein VLX92_00460 [Kofleriaceae bacterium]|nr:hypothetical protein [Kofleriaceae bacterium]